MMRIYILCSEIPIEQNIIDFNAPSIIKRNCVIASWINVRKENL